MALYRLGLLLCCMAMSGCGNQNPTGQSTPRPVVEALPTTTATADVDRRATLALKQNLVNSFPQNSPGLAVETGLETDGYMCGPNPSAPTERACLKAVREGVCEINTIVRTNPYTPEKAQVIRVCEVGAPTSKSN